MDPEVEALEKIDKQMMENKMAELARMAELEEKHDPESNQEFAELFRAESEPYVKLVNGHDSLKYGSELTVTTSFEVPTQHDGIFNVQVEVYTPKCIEKEAKKAAYLYAHGGGAIALSVADVRAVARCVAVDLNIAVCSVDYRLAPETKCPNNILDFYEVIKYVSRNADSLGMDPTKIIIGGESGGGYICLGAMVLLAERQEGDLVKLAMPAVPMVDDYCFSDPLAMTKEERQEHRTIRKIWKDLIAADFELQKTSPYLFPGKASDELLQRFPPTVMIEVEFDCFITEATRLATRLRRAGRLLELVIVPGATHTSYYMPGKKCSEIRSYMRKIVEEYVHS